MVERREFLKLSAVAAGLSVGSIRRALALPGDHTAGSIEDVQHIVVLMQENRSFDHYLGTLRGVRGHNDRFPIRLADGRPVWFQPRQDAPEQRLLPFHLNTARTAAQAVRSLDHSWEKTQAAINGGRYDLWPANKTDLTMGHYTREDIPFQFALADAFTVCDHYFCSLPGPTHPNRMFLMTGTNDPTGQGGGPVIDNNDVVDIPKLPPFTWTTYPERLQAAGISWQVYQQGLDWQDPYNGNYGLNVLQNFQQFIDAPQGSPLRERGFSVRTLDQFAEDAHTKNLPQISWLMPPAAFSEHPKYMPAYGATYIAQVLDALTADPAIWATTVLLVMYDENDGYFDHIVPPQPPTSVLPGQSSVSTAGEVHDVVNPLHQPHYTKDQLPYGLGPRVPMFVISPWSKGGYINSQVADHTSVICFIEARFGVTEPNISPWRRAVCSDLTSAFDFTRPAARPAQLISTAGYRARADEEVRTLPEPTPPRVEGTLMPQEPGTRPACPLPYALEVDFVPAEGGRITLRFANTGRQGASLYVYREGSIDLPWRFTVGAGDWLEATLPESSPQLAVFGPNGFYRAFQRGTAELSVVATAADDTLSLALANRGGTALQLVLTDNAYGGNARRITLSPGQQSVASWDITPSHHWYDVSVAAGNSRWRFAGHVETGRPSFSDAAATAPVLAD